MQQQKARTMQQQKARTTTTGRLRIAHIVGRHGQDVEVGLDDKRSTDNRNARTVRHKLPNCDRLASGRHGGVACQAGRRAARNEAWRAKRCRLRRGEGETEAEEKGRREAPPRRASHSSSKRLFSRRVSTVPSLTDLSRRTRKASRAMSTMLWRLVSVIEKPTNST